MFDNWSIKVKCGILLPTPTEEKKMAKVKKQRRKGSGNIVKIGTYYYARYMLNGKRHVESTHCTREDEALKYLDSKTHPLMYSTRRGQLEHIKTEIAMVDKIEEEYQEEANKIAIKDLVEKILSVKGLSGSRGGAAFYKTHVGRFANWMQSQHPYLEYMPLVTDEIAREFASYYRTTYGDKMHNKMVDMMLRTWRGLKDISHIKVNPWTKIQRVKGLSVKPRQNLTQDEISRLMDAAKDDPDENFILRLALNTGLRLSDCCLLKWEDIQNDYSSMSIIPVKLKHLGQKAKITIPISSELKALLGKRTKSDVYVTPEWARYYSSGWAVKRTRKIFQRAKIETQDSTGQTVKGFHSLRVWAITTMLDSGIPLATVQAIVGHFDPQMTQHYYRMDGEVAKNAVDKLADAKNAVETVEIPKTEYERLCRIEALYNALG